MDLAFGPDVDREIDAIVARYPNRMAALIPVLYVAQREFEVLSRGVLDLVARRLDLPAAKVLNTATFYTMFFKERVGRIHVQVCRNISCYLRGCDGLMAVMAEKLGLEPGQVSEDGQFSLEGVECLAACGTAPIVRINETYHEALSPEAFSLLLDDLARTGQEAPA